MSPLDYWKECISDAACECGLAIAPEQLESIALVVKTSHECYGMAFYEPPASDRMAEIEREWKSKIAKLERELESYRDNAETAIKQSLRIHRDDPVSIGEYGAVFVHGGRTEQVQ